MNSDSEIIKRLKNNSKNRYLDRRKQYFSAKLLKYFLSRIDNKKRKDELKQLLALFSNPNNRIFIQSNQLKGVIFDENPTLKKIISNVMAILKPKWSFSGKSNFRQNPRKIRSEKYNFDLKSENISLNKFKKYKRKNTKFLRKNNQGNEINRVLRYSIQKNNNQLALIPTIKNSIKNGNYNLNNKSFNIRKFDFLYPIPINKEQINMMVILDSSKSISWFVKYIEKFLPIITAYSFKKRDKIGYITYKNGSAHIIHYPTLNVQQIIGSINSTRIEGETPLSESLQLANQVFKKQQYNYPGMKNMILMISDCFPEPLEGGHKDIFDEPAYKKMISETKKIAENNIDLTIINPAQVKNNSYNWGRKLAKKLQTLYEINYLEINKPQNKNFFNSKEKMIEMELKNLVQEFIELNR